MEETTNELPRNYTWPWEGYFLYKKGRHFFLKLVTAWIGVCATASSWEECSSLSFPYAVFSKASNLVKLQQLALQKITFRQQSP